MDKTFSVISLGCPRNVVDSECIISEFKNNGYSFREDPLGSGTVIINTCAFIQDAKEESIDTILKVIDAKKEGHIKKIIVAGCLAQRYRSQLYRELKEVDEFRGVLNLDQLKNKTFTLTPRHYAYIKISEGCKNRCTYCIIPYLKGSYASGPLDSILREAEQLYKNGAKEIILVGQDTSLYGIDLYKKKKLASLLKKLADISTDNWVRVLYLSPLNLEKDVINVIRDSANLCKYIDLPIEHINDRILKQMGRKIRKIDIMNLIGYIRRNIPQAAIRTSLIVGFPGETEKEFKELLSFVREMKFERLGVFKYSREEGTVSYSYANQIPFKEKEKRFDMIMSLQQSISRKINEKFKDRVIRVLIEEKDHDTYLGRSEYDAPEVDGLVYVKASNLKTGSFYNVRITDTYEYDLVAEYEHS